VPSPQFPISDEWMFTRSINIFFDNGVFTCDGCTTSGTLLVAIGIIITKIFGFDFTAFRYLIILFGSLSVGFSYLLIKEITNKPKLSFLASFFLLVSPIFFVMSHLFTTDVPFLFFIVLAAYLAVKAIKSKDTKYFLFCAIATSAAIFLRQYAIAIPAAILIYFLISDRKFLKKIPVIISIILPIILFGAYSLDQILTTGQYYSQGFETRSPISISKDSVYYFWSTLIYLGFFFIPLAFLSHRYLKNKTFIAITIFLGVTAIGASLLLSTILSQTESMPYLKNIMNKNGLGVITIPGEEGKNNYFPDTFWFFVTALSILSSSILLTEIFSKIKKRNFAGPEFFLLIIVGIFLLSIITRGGGLYDRYIMLFIPLIALIFVEKISTSKILIPISIAALVIMFSFSFVGYLDYVNWSSVKWDAISKLESEGAPKEEITGGFEFCLYNYGMKYVDDYWKSIGIYNSPGIRPHDWKFCPGDDYVISFSENPKYFVSDKTYETLRKVSYCLFDDIACDEIFVLKSVR
jgi:4-amino-4-deoxy-L-arabinose transferase-like glycosyltransferase